MRVDHDPMEQAHHDTVKILTKLVDVLNCDELALICWNCGIQPQELMNSDIDWNSPIGSKANPFEVV